ncbi:MAG: hypothetical protein QM741_14645 [Rudaea sp.]|uniref:hypothetical protein n=1 Tax=Rudaea sp. TaxID=2136325 RepID=UPI0039E70DB0
MNLDSAARRTLRLTGWFAFIAIATAFAGMLLAGVLPFPLGPDNTQEQVVAFYSGGLHVVLGLVMTFVGLALIGVLIAGITYVMWRSEEEAPILTLIQGVSGTVTVMCLMLPIMMMTVAAFRPERNPEITVMLNDLSWLLFITPITPFIVQDVAIGACILNSRRALFPRWLAYFNFWVGFTFTFDVLAYVFHGGPLAWNGLLIFWLALTTYTLWVLAMGWGILHAVPAQAPVPAAAGVPSRAVIEDALA